jgi:hypothetical protein
MSSSLKFSSHYIYAFISLALVLAMALAPAGASALALSAAAPTGEQTAPSTFSASFTYPYVTVSTSATRVISIYNPIGNPGITSVYVTIPKSAAQSVSSGAFVDGFINYGTPQLAGSGPWTIVYPGSPSSEVILPPGANGHIDFNFASEAQESTPGVADAYPITVTVNYANGASQTQTITLYEGSATSVSLSPSSPSTTAGTPVTFTATTSSSDQNVPLTFSYSQPVSSGFSATFSPSSGLTGPSGKLPTSFTVTQAGTYTVTVAPGKPYGSYEDSGLLDSATATLTVNAATPSVVSITLSDSVPGVSPTYLTTYPETVTVSLTDAYGNPVIMPQYTSVTLSATVGTVGSSSTQIPTTSSCTENLGADASSVNLYFFPNATYGMPSSLTATVKIPSSSSYAGTYTGSVGNLVTSVFTNSGGGISSTSIKINGTTTGTVSITAGDAAVLMARVTYSYNSESYGQPNVPVHFAVIPVSSTFSGSPMYGTAYTNKTGWATFQVTDTRAGDEIYFVVNASAPMTSKPSHMLDNVSSEDSNTYAEWVAGPPASLVVKPALKYVSPGKSDAITVSFADAYGNPVSTLPPNTTYQIQVSASTGSLSASTIYIETGASGTTVSTATTYYAPSVTGTATITATTTAPGIAPGSATIKIVSKLPGVYVTSPANGATVKNATQTISGYAMPSPAAPSGTAVVSIKYSLNGAANVTAPITSTNSSGAAFFSFPVELSSGKNTIVVYATDSQGNVGSSSITLTLYVPPPVSFANSVNATSQPALAAVSGFSGISINYTNLWNSTQSVFVFAVWKNAAGQTVGVFTSSISSFQPGTSATAFIPETGLAPGTYKVSVFVVTTTGKPVSVSISTTVTISG